MSQVGCLWRCGAEVWFWDDGDFGVSMREVVDVELLSVPSRFDVDSVVVQNPGERRSRSGGWSKCLTSSLARGEERLLVDGPACRRGETLHRGRCAERVKGRV
jgi:hypothetical protein